MLNLHEIAEKQLRDQMKMGFLVFDKDPNAEGEQKNVEEHKAKLIKDLLEEIKSKKLKIELVKSDSYNEKICEVIAKEFVKNIPGVNGNQKEELDNLIVEGLMVKSEELEHNIHSLKSIEDVKKFGDKLFHEFELVDQSQRDGSFLREDGGKVTIKFSDKSAREHLNRNKKNLINTRIDEFKRMIYGAGLRVKI